MAEPQATIAADAVDEALTIARAQLTDLRAALAATAAELEVIDRVAGVKSGL